MWVWWLFACSSGPCSGLDDVSTAISSMESAYHQELAAKGLAQACELPPPIEEALNSVGDGFGASLFDQKAAAEAPEIWAAACPGGVEVLVEGARLSPIQMRELVHTECKLDRYGWSSADFAKSKGLVVLPVMLQHLLEDESGFHKGIVLQALAGM